MTEPRTSAGEYVAFDLETTGLDPERDRVIEVGAVAFTLDAAVDRLQRFANPGRPIPAAVLKLTGIDPRLVAEAPPPESAMRALAEFMQGRQPVGHGARLDLDFLAAVGLWPAGTEVLDTLEIARILMPDAPSHSLPALAAEMGLRQARPHRALDDADATRQLFLRLRELAAGLEEDLKASILSLVAPYPWAIASFFAQALTAPAGPRDSPPPEPPPERPTVGREEVCDDPDRLAALLGPEGPLAALPDYEYREAQQQMLRAVAQVMRRGGRLLVEAGTGTGKSLAYLVPALARAARRGERVVVSTHTHTLQEQLVHRDLPALRRWLPWDFEAALLKGRPNYLSLRRWRRYLAEPCLDADELKFKLKILVWLHRTRTGDRSELRLQGSEEAFWARVASDAFDCLGVRCGDATCFVHRARARAERADLVVVNHALLLSDAETEGSLIPAHDHLVIDEAHHLEEAATQALRREVDGRALSALLERLVRPEPGNGQLRRAGLVPRLRSRLGQSPELLEAVETTALRARETCLRLFDLALAWVAGQLGENAARREETLRLLPQHREGQDWRPLLAAAEDAVTVLAALEAQLRRVIASAREWSGGGEPDQELRDLESARAALSGACGLLQEAFRDPDPERVYWLAWHPRSEALAVRSAPLEVGERLRERVYARVESLVLTSASLVVAGRFDHFRSRVGLGPEVETLTLPSPFDYLEQALVCLPTDLPDPQSEGFEIAVTEVIADVAGRLRGRTLVLFTSYHQLRLVYQALKHRDDLDEVLILGQGIDGQRRQVLRAFEESARPLLLGTASFWEGVDIPGERLSCVIIVRLPFPVPGEPVYAARAERLRDPFLQYALPQAVLRLKQGFGRLIRRRGDRGAVVILDRRVVERDYGRAFLQALPPASRYLGPAAGLGQRIQDWLASGPTEPSPRPPGGR
ncbi:MAG TPA: helicase C-terminal domain-containing protein [Candidatus Dormibacteraeota bacterium]|nr:helicase C-terminal domain-containing protein [Candidatus Dormibacteraeota bacterium]